MKRASCRRNVNRGEGRAGVLIAGNLLPLNQGFRATMERFRAESQMALVHGVVKAKCFDDFTFFAHFFFERHWVNLNGRSNPVDAMPHQGITSSLSTLSTISRTDITLFVVLNSLKACRFAVDSFFSRVTTTSHQASPNGTS